MSIALNSRRYACESHAACAISLAYWSKEERVSRRGKEGILTCEATQTDPTTTASADEANSSDGATMGRNQRNQVKYCDVETLLSMTKAAVCAAQAAMRSFPPSEKPMNAQRPSWGRKPRIGASGEAAVAREEGRKPSMEATLERYAPKKWGEKLWRWSER